MIDDKSKHFSCNTKEYAMATIWINELPHPLTEGTTLFSLRAAIKPEADVIIYNGAVVSEDLPLRDGDAVVYIRRGEVPEPEMLEALMAARHTPGVHRQVKQGIVGIAGLGGLGSAIAIALARLGVGRLILVDFDIVEPSNLNRQQYFVDQIGLPKTEALCANLRRVNPYITLEPHSVRLTAENTAAIFKDARILVEAFDRAEEKAQLLEAFLRAFPNRPVVAASGVAGHGPSNGIRTRQAGRITVVGDESTAAAPGAGLMAPLVGVAGHHQANAVLRLLLNEKPTA